MKYSVIRVSILISVFCYASLGAGLLPGTVYAEAQMTPAELELWFNDESEQQASEVNEGDLVFLDKLPEKNVTHSSNRFSLSPTSLKDGWVTLNQCHQNLDAVSDAQVVYRYKQMRNLKVESSQGIDRSWVEGASVQMKGITKNASICISAEVHILYKNKDGTLSLRNGPYHRKFLDGYYPMRVTLDVMYPDELIELKKTSPVPGMGVKFSDKPGHARLDMIFEGKLMTEFRFKLK
ncbi:MAG: hypothetical protein BMS9Abin26_1647 [Gammaproteobacteria bacterium]|nr:MAG: hypothetical protein BMS9Abin26_1647 [Gammaproteobacteria bacterium]